MATGFTYRTLPIVKLVQHSVNNSYYCYFRKLCYLRQPNLTEPSLKLRPVLFPSKCVALLRRAHLFRKKRKNPPHALAGYSCLYAKG